MATQTTYYEFNKPQGTDLVNPLVDTNPNWDIADSALHDLNVRSAANTTEIVSLGVHALSTLNTDATILKWIATANFTDGDTFTLNGVAIAASTPSGEALKTNAYVAGAVVIAALNSDSTAMTVYVTGSTVASDAERLGGELPSYYATTSDMSDAVSDITNLKNLAGNTSIVGIGDGTLTGAVSALNADLSDKASGVYSTNETVIGTYLNKPLYRIVINVNSAITSGNNDFGSTSGLNIKDLIKLDASINQGTTYSEMNLTLISSTSGMNNRAIWIQTVSAPTKPVRISCSENFFVRDIIIEYTKTTD